MLQPGVALVTGAGSGIGRQVALELGQRGWKVLAVDKNVQGLESLQREFATVRHVCQGAEADVTDPKQLAARIAQLEAVAGPVDLLVA
jgi:NADP-dependent 3-hydroxy acid dehydrogenase YdfG